VYFAVLFKSEIYDHLPWSSSNSTGKPFREKTWWNSILISSFRYIFSQTNHISLGYGLKGQRLNASFTFPEILAISDPYSVRSFGRDSKSLESLIAIVVILRFDETKFCLEERISMASFQSWLATLQSFHRLYLPFEIEELTGQY
jgi:hypothetical protein